MFAISGTVVLRVENMKPGNEVTKKMPSGALIIGETVTPFVLQRKVRGHIENLNMKRAELVGVCCFKQRCTTFTKLGYVSLLLNVPQGQFYVYIKQEWLKDFYAAFCMTSISEYL